jgi:hypothetical protein
MELSNRYMKNDLSSSWITKILKELGQKFPRLRFFFKIWIYIFAFKEGQDFVRAPAEVYETCKDAYISVAPVVEKVTCQYIDLQILASRVHKDSQPLVFEGTSAVTAGTTFVFTAKT